MQDRTIIVALDLPDPAYGMAGAKKQIDLISEKITALYKELHAKDPKAMIMIAWPENGIHEPNSKWVDISVKEYLQTKMSALTTEMPFLTVVAGSLSVIRPLMKTEHKVATAEEKIKKHISRYSHEFIVKTQAEEMKIKSDTPEQITLHKNIASKLLEPRARREETFVVSNTSYVFQSVNEEGKQVPKMFKCRKMIPFFEIKSVSDIFRPGSASSGGSLLTLHHPDSGKPFKLMIDICYEHRFAKLKNIAEKPLIQLILSNTASLKPGQLIGQHVVHVDTTRKTCHIDMDPESTSSRIEVHRAKASSETSPEGPIPPFYPLECKLVQGIDDKLRELIELKNHFVQLKTIKEFPELQKQLNEFNSQFPLIKNTRPVWLSEVLADDNEKESRDFVDLNLKELLAEINLLEYQRGKFIRYVSENNSKEGYQYLLRTLDKIQDSQFGKYYMLDSTPYFAQLPFSDDLKNLAKKWIAEHTQRSDSQNMNSLKIPVGTEHKVPAPDRPR